MSILLASLCNFLFVSCDNEGTTNDESITAKEYFAQKSDNLKQVAIINTAQLPKTITLQGGTQITINSGTFTKGGVAVSGEIKLEMYEVLKPSTAIFLGTNTNYTTGSNYLETDGFLYINASQNGVNLDQTLTKDLVISIPTTKANGTMTQLWKGNENVQINGQAQFGWADVNNNDFVNNDLKFENTIWSQAGVFQFNFGKLGWANCDVIANVGKEVTTVSVKLTGVVGTLASFRGYEGDTFVFFCQKGAPIVAQLYTKVDNVTVKSYDNTMPVGTEGTFIAFTISATGKISVATQKITITKNMSLTLDLTQTTKEELDALIKSIDGYSGK